MGTIRFRLPSRDPGDWPELANAFLGDCEGHVESSWPTIHGDELRFERQSDQSTRLHTACPLRGLGRPVLSTAALCEREAPYNLLVELARGRLGQVRELAARWRHAGLAFPNGTERELDQAQKLFCRASCMRADDDAVTDAAGEALSAVMSASERLMAVFIRGQLTARRRRMAHLPILLSCPLKGLRPGGGWEKPYCAAFTAAKAAVEWSLVESNQGAYDWTLPDEQVAFAERNRLVAMGGPLLDFRPGGMPAWLTDWCHDYWSFQSLVSDFVETAVNRYGGRIRWWEIAASPNRGYGDELDEEYRLALTARAIEVARQADHQIQLALRVVQPFGEYQRDGADRLSPRQFAEALVRSGVGLTSITLEIAVGFTPHGTAYRDRFAMWRLLDSWSRLGVPLTIALAFPSQQRHDEMADSWARVAAPQWKEPWGEPAQAAWMVEMLPLLMSKTSVMGIEWAHFSDAASHRFPHAGLTRADESVKMILERLTRFRQSYWRQSESPS